MGGELDKVGTTALSEHGAPKRPRPAHHNSDSTLSIRNAYV